MALSVKKGSFTKSGTSQNIDVGFPPKAVILFGHNILSQGAGTFQEHYGFTIGISDGTTHCVNTATSEDNAASADTYRIWDTTKVWQTVDPLTGTVGSTGTVAFSGNNLAFTWSSATNTPVIQYIAFGGSDITNAKVAVLETGTVATGNKAYTGIGFQGDFVFFNWSPQLNNTLNTADCMPNFGCAASSSQEWAITATSEDGRAIMDTWRLQRTDCCQVGVAATSGVLNQLANFVSFDSDGFTLNWTDAPIATTNDIGVLVIKGGIWEAGNFVQPDATGNSDVTLANSTLAPAVVFLASYGTTAQTTVQTHNRISIGATTATDQGCTYAGDTTGAADAVTMGVDKTDKCIGLYTEAATATSSTTQAEAQLATSGLNTAGKFTLNWTTIADTTDRQLLYWVLGSTAVAGNAVERALATETITLSESIPAKQMAKIRTRTDTAITIGETRTRLSAKNRPIATQSTALSENVIRVKGKVKTLATETITVAGGTIARLLAKIRTPAAPDTTTISETRQRLGSKSRPLSTQTVALSESLQRIKGKIKSLSTETVIVGGGTAARLSAKIRALAAQTVIIVENRDRLKASMRTIATQTVTIGESLVRQIARQVARALATQTVALSESLARLKAAQRIRAETVTKAESVQRISAKNRTIPQSLSVAAGSLSRIKSAIKTLPQTIITTEQISRLGQKNRIVAQTVALADSVVRQIIGGAVEITRTLSQTVVLSDSLGRRLAAQRILTQTVPKAESLARVRGVLRTLSQSIPISGSPLRIKSALRPILQTITTSDNASRLNALRRTVIQTMLSAENLTAETVGNLARALVETVTVSDNIVRRTAKLVILDQFVIIAEQTSRLSEKLRTIPTQTITLSDSATNELNVIIKHVLKTLSQTIAITEYAKIEVVKKSQRFRKILDPSIKRLISNHPAWLLGTRGMHNDYEEFAP